MAVKRKVKDKGPHAGNTTRDITLPAFSYPASNGLAQVIIDLWNDSRLYTSIITDRQNGVPTTSAWKEATKLINKDAKLDLARAVIITEEEHDDDYVQQDPTEWSLYCQGQTESKQQTPLTRIFSKP